MDEIALHDAVGGLAGLGQFDDVNTVAGEQGHLRVAHLKDDAVGQVDSERLKGVFAK